MHQQRSDTAIMRLLPHNPNSQLPELANAPAAQAAISSSREHLLVSTSNGQDISRKQFGAANLLGHSIRLVPLAKVVAAAAEQVLAAAGQ